MKRLLSLIFLLLFASTITFWLLGQPVNSQNQIRQEFVITPGQSVDQIGANLKAANLIRSQMIFKATVFLKNISPKIQAGYFYLAPSQSTFSITDNLTKAASRQIWVTIPEGLRRQEIANLIIDKLQADKVKHNFNPEDFINKTATLEGRLFPETYAFNPDVTTTQVIDRLVTQFNSVISELDIPPANLPSIITLASIIEREAGADTERAEVAGVLTNRLNNSWPIQADATIQFALANARCRLRICDWWPDLSSDDLKFVSPYNTYLNQGLPPGPIANPGRTSLEAAANPHKTNNWFYIHDTSGQIHYAPTLEKHNQNICTYLKRNC